MGKIIEQVQFKGTLFLKLFRDGKEVGEVRQNLIVTTGRNNLAKLLAGQTGMHVTRVAVGEGTAPAAATDTDATLVNPFSVAVTARVGVGLESQDGTTFDDPRIVQFHFSFGLEDAVGMEINEYGLLCADGSLFSRIVRDAPFEKTNIDQIKGFWQIQF